MVDLSSALVAVASDSHLNSRMAICPPRVHLDGDDTYVPNKTQGALWDSWCQFWNEAERRAAAASLPLVAVFAGDILDLNKHDSMELVSQNPQTMMNMARETYTPIAEASAATIIVRGTEAHTGKHCWAEDMLAGELPNVVYDDVNKTASWWWFYGYIGGVLFDVRHHPPTRTRLRYMRGSMAARISSRLRMDYVARGTPIPDVALSGHVHFPADSGRLETPRSFTTPAWTFQNPYGSRLGFTPECEPVGGLFIECRDGKYHEDWMLFDVKRRVEPWGK